MVGGRVVLDELKVRKYNQHVTLVEEVKKQLTASIDNCKLCLTNTEYNKEEASSEKSYPGVQEEMKEKNRQLGKPVRLERRDVWL